MWLKDTQDYQNIILCIFKSFNLPDLRLRQAGHGSDDYLCHDKTPKYKTVIILIRLWIKIIPPNIAAVLVSAWTKAHLKGNPV